MKTHNVVSVSGGKDSTATLLLAIEREVENLQCVFADTGHEDELTYEYLDYLEQRLGITIRRVRADFTRQIEHKRKTIAEKWPGDLQSGQVGKWKLTKVGKQMAAAIFARAEGAVEGSAEVLAKLAAAGLSEPPPLPADPFKNQQTLLWGFVGARPPMSAEQAQQEVARALAVMQPTGNPFLDLCIWKGRFPSSKVRFCTEELKVIPIQDQVVFPLLRDQTVSIESWQGIRWDESSDRASALEREGIEPDAERVFAYRPILSWSANDVFTFHRKHGVKHNPLYELGMGRVGCMPCVNCRKDELSEIAGRFPEVIERLAEWERLVSLASKRGSPTFFPAVNDPTVSATDAIKHDTHGIRRMAEWASTDRGGRQFDLLGEMTDEAPQCSSIYGLCESAWEPIRLTQEAA